MISLPLYFLLLAAESGRVLIRNSPQHYWFGVMLLASIEMSRVYTNPSR